MINYLPEAKTELENLARQFAKRFGITYYNALRHFDEANADLNDEVPIPIRSDSIEDEETYTEHLHDIDKNGQMKIGDTVHSNLTSYLGEIERVVEDGYIIKWWHNPVTKIGYAHMKVDFGEVTK